MTQIFLIIKLFKTKKLTKNRKIINKKNKIIEITYKICIKMNNHNSIKII